MVLDDVFLYSDLWLLSSAYIKGTRPGSDCAGPQRMLETPSILALMNQLLSAIIQHDQKIVLYESAPHWP